MIINFSKYFVSLSQMGSISGISVITMLFFFIQKVREFIHFSQGKPGKVREFHIEKSVRTLLDGLTVCICYKKTLKNALKNLYFWFNVFLSPKKNILMITLFPTGGEIYGDQTYEIMCFSNMYQLFNVFWVILYMNYSNKFPLIAK